MAHSKNESDKDKKNKTQDTISQSSSGNKHISRRKKKNPFRAFRLRYRRFRRALSVDFEKPLRTKDQLIVMVVILVISCLLFTGVYFLMLATHPQQETTPVQTSAAEKQQLPVTDHSTVVSGTGQDIASSAASDISDKSSASNESTESMESTESKDPKESKVSSDTSENSQEELPSLLPEQLSYSTLTVQNETVHYGKMILVNKEYNSIYDGENVKEMINIKSDSYYLASATVSLDRDIIGYVDRMMDDFHDLYGNSEIMIACGYRSSQQQAILYQDELESKGEDGEKWVAPPGFSEHQTGFSFDMNLHIEDGIGGLRYDGMGNYAWFNENCQHYGFVIRYPEGKETVTGYEYEPWHFRYVGIPAAVYMTQHQLAFEEFLDEMEDHTIESPLIVEDQNRRWLLYYTPMSYGFYTEVSVPDNADYEISGNNHNGFLVTVPVLPTTVSSTSSMSSTSSSASLPLSSTGDSFPSSASLMSDLPSLLPSGESSYLSSVTDSVRSVDTSPMQTELLLGQTSNDTT